jgi:protoporphyrinogen oxidase
LPPNRISAEWGQQKLKFLAAWRDRSLLLLGLQALNETKRLRRKVVSYPRRGIEAIPVALAERFLETGGEIKTSAAAVSVEEHRDRAEIRTSGGQVFECDFLLSSIPLPTLVRLLPGSHSKLMSPFVEDLKQRKTVFFLLYFDTPKVMDHQCLYFTQSLFSFRRVTEFKHLSLSMAPPDRSSLCVEVTADDDEEPDVSRERIEVLLEELDQTGHCDVRDYAHHDVMIIPNTYPVYRREYSEALKKALTDLSSLGRIMTFGRQGLFFYNTMNNSVIDGHRLGRRCLDAASFSTLRDELYRGRMGLIQLPRLR